MKRLPFLSDSVNERHISEAVEALRTGEMVAYPTDTVYGLAVNAADKHAVERLCRLKNLNPDKNLLTIGVPDISTATEFVRIDNAAFSILKDNSPGPFTFVLPATSRLPRTLRNRRTVGIRIPDNEIALSMLRAFGAPIFTTSLPGEASSADDIAILLEKLSIPVAVMLDGGDASESHSTIVDLTDSSEPEILRKGKGEL